MYREEFSTFEAYCQKRWRFERNYAYKLMQGSQVVAVCPMGHINERQARELAPLLKDKPELIPMRRIFHHYPSNGTSGLPFGVVGYYGSFRRLEGLNLSYRQRRRPGGSSQ